MKDIGSFVNHDIERNRNSVYSEYISKLIDIVNANDYFLDEYSKKWASDFNWEKQSKVIKHFM